MRDAIRKNTAEARVVYRPLSCNAVKYVRSSDRNLYLADKRSVQLCQRATDAASLINGDLMRETRRGGHAGISCEVLRIDRDC